MTSAYFTSFTKGMSFNSK